MDYQHRQSKCSMSWGEMSEWASYFITLGKKFKLLSEFKENGII